MKKFDLFLKQMNFKEDVFKKADLFRVVLDKNNSAWELYINLNKVIDITLLDDFINKVSLFFKVDRIDKCHVIISFTSLENSERYALDYFRYALDNIINDQPSYAIIKNFNINFIDNQYVITIDKDSHYISQYLNNILEQLQLIGLQYPIVLEVDESLKTTKQLISEVTVKQTQRLSEEALNAKNAKKIISENKFSTLNKASIVPIKEVPITSFDLDKYQHQVGKGNFILFGQVSQIEIKETRKTPLLSFVLTDDEDAIVVKQFVNQGKDLTFAQSLKNDMYLEVKGNAQFDSFLKEVVIFAREIKVYNKTEKELREDKAKDKRVEFHVHTKMSNLDAVTSAEDYIIKAAQWGHKAIGFTDHNALYAYPDIARAAKKHGVKPIYGVEMDYVNEYKFLITSQVSDDKDFKLSEMTYVVFDIETTGLSTTRDKIIEIGATKIIRGQVSERFQTFVNPQVKISDFISNLTGITDDDLLNAPLIEEALSKFFDFADGACLVAHNALFDVGHLQQRALEHGFNFDFTYVVDTLNFARYFYQNDLKRFNLKAVAKFFEIKQTQHHRADDDAFVTAQIWILMMHHLQTLKITNFNQINASIDPNVRYQMHKPSHLNLYALNSVGLKNIYQIVSESLTKNYFDGPRLTIETLKKYREGVIVSSGCYQGEVFQAALNLGEEALIKAISHYDLIEVQPPSAYQHLCSDIGEGCKEIIEGMLYKIIVEAKKQNKLVIASGDVHYLNKEDAIYRDMYIRVSRVGKGIHELKNYEIKPEVHLKTTKEMLSDFSFLDPVLANEIVVKNTNLLASKIENIQIFPSELYSLPDDAFKDKLNIDSAANEVKRIVYEKAHQMYGNPIHPLVEQRIEKELNSIIGNDFAPIYYISYLLVKKSVDEGYVVGSRGSVGSSLVATLMDITEVNPLRPHYRSKDGQIVIFEKLPEDKFVLTPLARSLQPNFKDVKSGFDLPDVILEDKNEYLLKDGQDIPFETFLGFEGNKVPDIDLNFSGEYQARAHEYVRELLGSDYSFRAGTIQTVASQTAYGYVKGYLEETQTIARQAQIKRLSTKIEGVQRSTGQHPGGIVVVPKNHDIFDITPIQYPANDTTANWYTTHFDYHAYEDNLLKLDILAHDNPTMIKFLMDYVSQHPSQFPFDNVNDIPLDDKKVYGLFNGTSVIGLTPEELDSQVSTFGIPEFGTDFTRQMLTDTKPQDFAGLVKISGLSHGTNVWLNNAQALVKGETEYGKISFNEIIGCRDDIMIELSEKGLEPKKAFDIMEFVRKGKPSKDEKMWSVFEKEMLKYDVKPWYIWSASKIKYMFPKAHAAAYVIMALRIGWFKIYHPELFYSAFFSKRVSQFDYEIMIKGKNAIKNSLEKIKKTPSYELKAKDNQLNVTLGVALEMYLRGIKFLPVNINISQATEFVIEEKGLRMPFIAVDGLGESVAIDIVENRQEKLFTSINDVKKRTKINKTVFEKLENYGAFMGLNTENDVIDDGLFAL